MTAPTFVDDHWTVAQLRDRARDMKIPAFGNMTKAELIRAINDSTVPEMPPDPGDFADLGPVRPAPDDPVPSFVQGPIEPPPVFDEPEPIGPPPPPPRQWKVVSDISVNLNGIMTKLRAGRIITEGHYDVAKLLAGGAVLAPYPGDIDLAGTLARYHFHPVTRASQTVITCDELPAITETSPDPREADIRALLSAAAALAAMKAQGKDYPQPITKR